MRSIKKILMMVCIGLYLSSNAGYSQQTPDYLIIGDENAIDGKPNNEKYLFGYIRYMTADLEGNMYLADFQKKEINKFSPQGEFLCSIGRKGQGPGEFISPGKLRTDGSNYLYLFDWTQIKQYSLSGEYIKDFNLSNLGETYYNIDLGFEIIDNEKFVIHGTGDSDVKNEKVFYLADFSNKSMKNFGLLPEYEIEKKVLKLISPEERLYQFYSGGIVYDPNQQLLHFVSRNNPQRLITYELGVDEPKTVWIDKNMSGGFDYKSMVSSKFSRKQAIADQTTGFWDSFICGKVLYRQITDNRTKKTSIIGYSTESGEIVSEVKIIMKSEDTFDGFLCFVDNKGNAYFSLQTPYPRVLRINIKNLNVIDLDRFQ